MKAHNITTDDSRHSLWALPVTLRQVESAGIKLQDGFGIDDAEHEELLDQAGMLRLTFGIEYDIENNDVYETWDVEVYQARLDGRGPRWEGCAAWDRHGRNGPNSIRVEELIASLYGADRLARKMRRIRGPFDTWAYMVDKGEV